MAQVRVKEISKMKKKKVEEVVVVDEMVSGSRRQSNPFKGWDHFSSECTFTLKYSVDRTFISEASLL